MEDEDKQNSLEVLHNNEEWVIWKTRDDRWTHELKKEGFHQLLSLELPRACHSVRRIGKV
jgi:hypothetical protein